MALSYTPVRMRLNESTLRLASGVYLRVFHFCLCICVFDCSLLVRKLLYQQRR